MQPIEQEAVPEPGPARRREQHRLRGLLVPEVQRRTLDELRTDLDLRRGAAEGKRSAFWTLLFLSAVIASAGVLADSTATVVGAMIIAPLSTPIMGIAVASVARERNGALAYVIGGVLLVVAVGFVASYAVPSGADLTINTQIQGRISPSLLDLIAALATGLAGAVAMARRDLTSVLPGVAIAISLVPPLAVVGIGLGAGRPAYAAGAMLLFTSNFVALVLAGTFVFAVLGYGSEGRARLRSVARRIATATTLTVFIVLPLAANSIVTWVIVDWRADAEQVVASWLRPVPGAEVTSVEFTGLTLEVVVLAPGDLPSTARLLSDLDEVLPAGIDVRLTTQVGERRLIGRVGGELSAEPAAVPR